MSAYIARCFCCDWCSTKSAVWVISVNTKAKGQQARAAALHSIVSCPLLHMNFSFLHTYYYLNVCHLFLGTTAVFFLKKGKQSQCGCSVDLCIRSADIFPIHFPATAETPCWCCIFRPPSCWILLCLWYYI